MNIIYHSLKRFQKVIEAVCHHLEGKMDFLTFQETLRKELNQLGTGILIDVLEAKDQYIWEHKEERKGWEVVRRDDNKEILTVFGQVRYRRTYYRNHKTKQYAYLVDNYTGYKPKQRIDPLVKGEALDKAIELSYRKSGEKILPDNEEVIISPEAVKEIIHDLKKEEFFTSWDNNPDIKDNKEHKERNQEKNKEKKRDKKKKCQFLFIEADEDHVPAQKGGKRRYLAKLVYIHEGKEEVGKGRMKLKHPHYFAGLYPDSEDLWFEVLDYLDEHYDLEATEKIFISGDGASWIKKGLEIIPESVFVLDRFHLEKYLQEGLSRYPSTYLEVRRAMERGDKEEVKVLLKNAQKDASEEREVKKLQVLKRYLMNNWEGIIIYQEYSHLSLGGSAEGHVSHILSARLSSRPMGWSKKGVDHMSYLRAMKANGYSVKASYLRVHRQNLPPFTLDEETITKEREREKEVFREIYNNIPILKGPVTNFSSVLKELTKDFSWMGCSI